jgi:hypothetical protein
MEKLEPSIDLYNRIINNIAYEESLIRLRRRLFFYFGIFSGLLLSLSFVLKNFFIQISNSGFVELLGLIFSDFQIIASHSLDYVLSLVESLPILSFTLSSAILLVAIICAVKLFKYTFKIKELNNLTWTKS